MTRLRRLLIASVVMLAGCASQGGSPALFMLDQGYPPARRQAPPANSRPALVVDTVAVATYLDQGGLVYQTAPYRVVVAHDNRWASPLSEQLTGSLYAAVATQLDDVSVRRTRGPGSRPASHLHVQVDEFLGHFDGSAHITGQWTLVDIDGTPLAGQRFQRRIPLDRDGYAALVASLSRGWRQTVRAIASKTEEALVSRD